VPLQLAYLLLRCWRQLAIFFFSQHFRSWSLLIGQRGSGDSLPAGCITRLERGFGILSITTVSRPLHGQADQHWLAAEREILAASTAALARKPAPHR
jgi:DUF2934 family protein